MPAKKLITVCDSRRLEESYAMNASGTATQANEVYMDSLEAKVSQLHASLTELASDTIPTDFLKGAVDAGDSIVQLLDNTNLLQVALLVYFCDIDNDAFSGMNGLVNDRPYMIINQNMTPERIRSTIAHEMAHFIFIWPVDMAEKDIEAMATAISGVFLFPAEDAKRELGIRRSAVTKDMTLICKEYGISMYWDIFNGYHSFADMDKETELADTFEDVEKLYYSHFYRDYVEGKNGRNEKNRHPEK